MIGLVILTSAGKGLTTVGRAYVEPRTSPLRVYRTSLGLNQAGLAKLAGVSRKTISNLETRRTKPQLATADAIAGVLGLSVEELFPPERGR